MSTVVNCPGCGRNMEPLGELHTADCALCNVCGHICLLGVDDDGSCPCCLAATPETACCAWGT